MNCDRILSLEEVKELLNDYDLRNAVEQLHERVCKLIQLRSKLSEILVFGYISLFLLGVASVLMYRSLLCRYNLFILFLGIVFFLFLLHFRVRNLNRESDIALVVDRNEVLLYDRELHQFVLRYCCVYDNTAIITIYENKQVYTTVYNTATLRYVASILNCGLYSY